MRIVLQRVAPPPCASTAGGSRRSGAVTSSSSGSGSGTRPTSPRGWRRRSWTFGCSRTTTARRTDRSPTSTARSWSSRSSRCTRTSGRVGDPRGATRRTPEVAAERVEALAAALEAPASPCPRGVFGAAMEVELVNDGPFTLVLEGSTLSRGRPTRAPARGSTAHASSPSRRPSSSRWRATQR